MYYLFVGANERTERRSTDTGREKRGGTAATGDNPPEIPPTSGPLIKTDPVNWGGRRLRARTPFAFRPPALVRTVVREVFPVFLFHCSTPCPPHVFFPAPPPTDLVRVCRPPYGSLRGTCPHVQTSPPRQNVCRGNGFGKCVAQTNLENFRRRKNDRLARVAPAKCDARPVRGGGSRHAALKIARGTYFE